MPKKPEKLRPVAFFKLGSEDFKDLDAAVERIMRVIEERSPEQHQGEDGDGAHPFPSRQPAQNHLSIRHKTDKGSRGS